MDEYDKDTDYMQASRLIHTKTYTADAVHRVNLFTSWGMTNYLNLIDSKLFGKMSAKISISRILSEDTILFVI